MALSFVALSAHRLTRNRLHLMESCCVRTNFAVYLNRIQPLRVPHVDQRHYTRKITLDEVEKHNKENDCWMSINGKVYDVTEFIYEHPGGEIILDGRGTDATKLFEEAQHSDDAKKMMQDFYIGELDSS